jgi:hypothetical protein
VCVIVSVTFWKPAASNTCRTFALIEVVGFSVTFQGLGNFSCYLHEVKVNPHHGRRDVVKMRVNLMPWEISAPFSHILYNIIALYSDVSWMKCCDESSGQLLYSQFWISQTVVLILTSCLEFNTVNCTHVPLLVMLVALTQISLLAEIMWYYWRSKGNFTFVSIASPT